MQYTQPIAKSFCCGSNIRYIMTASIRSFRVQAAFGGSCKGDLTDTVRSSRLQINGESGRQLQAGARMGSALYRSLKLEATKTCRPPLVYYVLLGETTCGSKGKVLAYQINIETLKKAEQPTGLGFGKTYRTKTRKFCIDTMSKWTSCSTRKQKTCPSKTTSEHSSDTKDSSDDESKDDAGPKRKTQGPSESVKETNKGDLHSKKANPKIRKAT
jgi:hypothetical protein